MSTNAPRDFSGEEPLARTYPKHAPTPAPPAPPAPPGSGYQPVHGAPDYGQPPQHGVTAVDSVIRVTESQDPALAAAVIFRNHGPRGVPHTGDVHKIRTISEQPQPRRLCAPDSYHVLVVDRKGREVLWGSVECTAPASDIVAALKAAAKAASFVHPGVPADAVVRIVQSTTTYRTVPLPFPLEPPTTTTQQEP